MIKINKSFAGFVSLLTRKLNYFSRPTLKSLSKKEFKNTDKSGSLKRTKYKILNCLKGPNSWLPIVASIIVLVVMTLCDFDIFSIFFFKSGEIYHFTENWLSYFINLFSSIIALAIFLISGIHIKNQSDDNIGIIFQEALLFPLIYFSLTVFGIMLFISFHPYFLTELQIIHLTVLGLYLFLVELILIAYLFQQAFNFIKPDFFLKKKYEEIGINLRKEIEEDFITKISEKVFLDALTELKLKPKTFMSSMAGYYECKINLNDRMIINDIYIYKIKRIFNKVQYTTDDVFFFVLALNQGISNGSILFWIKNPKLIKEIKKLNLKSLVKTTKLKTEETEIGYLKKNLQQKLLESIKSSNFNVFDTILEHYNFICEQFGTIYSELNISSSNVESSIINKFPTRPSWNILNGLDKAILSAYLLTLKEKHKEMNDDLIKFVFGVYVISITQKCMPLLDSFRYLLPQFLINSYMKEELDLSQNQYFFLRLKEIIGYYSLIEMEKCKSVDKIKVYKILIVLFEQNINLISILIESENFNGFINAWDEFYQLENSAKKIDTVVKLERFYKNEVNIDHYFKGSVFALFSWTIHLYRKNKISIITLRNIEKKMLITNVDFSIVFSSFLIEDSKYIWNDWDSDKHKSGEIYYLVPAPDWILFAGVLFIIKYEQIFLLKYENFVKRPNWYLENISTNIKEITDNYELKWKSYFNDQPLSEIQRKTDNIQSQINYFNYLYGNMKVKETIAKSLSVTAINKFQQSNYDRWLKCNPLWKLFYSRETLQIVKYDSGLKTIIIETVLVDGKKWFVYDDEYYIHLYTEFGFELNRKEKYEFVEGVTENKNEKNRPFENLIGCLETLIGELRYTDNEPNLIIISRVLVLHDREFMSSAKFQKASLIGYINEPGNLDYYDGIPFYYLENQNIPLVIVANFEKSFSMKMWQPEENKPESMFQLEVSPYNNDDAESIIKNKQGPWDFEQLNDKVKNDILTSVNIEVHTKMLFEVLDESAYRVGKINKKLSLREDEE